MAHHAVLFSRGFWLQRTVQIYIQNIETSIQPSPYPNPPPFDPSLPLECPCTRVRSLGGAICGRGSCTWALAAAVTTGIVMMVSVNYCILSWDNRQLYRVHSKDNLLFAPEGGNAVYALIGVRR